jgi:hypothetical protein
MIGPPKDSAFPAKAGIQAFLLSANLANDANGRWLDFLRALARDLRLAGSSFPLFARFAEKTWIPASAGKNGQKTIFP